MCGICEMTRYLYPIKNCEAQWPTVRVTVFERKNKGNHSVRIIKSYQAMGFNKRLETSANEICVFLQGRDAI